MVLEPWKKKTLAIMEEEEQVGNPNTTTVAIAGLSIETAATSIQAVVDEYLGRCFYQRSA